MSRYDGCGRRVKDNDNGMKRIAIHTLPALALCAALAVLAGGCSGRGGRNGGMADQTDSLSYVVGMNIAYNIMRMDSTLRPEAVVAGITDVLGGHGKMTADEARTFFLAYMNYGVYERVRNYEEQYLADLAASDRDVVRTASGLTYKVGALGDMNNTIGNDRDTVAIRYRATTLAGKEVDPASARGDTLRLAAGKLKQGLKEGVKLVGEGGRITLWLPSSLAYGAAGDEELGIAPNEMLRYEVEVVEVKTRRR